VTLADIALRRNDYERSEELLREDLAIVKNAAQQSYWDLQQAWKTLAIQQVLVEQGAEVERVLGERRAFDTTPAEYSDALATLEGRRANTVRAQRLVALASDRLKALVDDPEVPLASEVLLRPAGAFSAEPFPYDLRTSVETALVMRPEVARAALAIEDADLRARVADNLRRARLDLEVGASVAGLDAEWDDAYSSLAQDDYYTFFLGLVFELPIGNRAAAARSRQARHQSRAALLEYERVLRDVTLSVKEALREVQTSWELVGATRAFRLAQTENLRALQAEEEQRSQLTPEFLALKFQRQERLAEARLREVEALADYHRAIAAFQRAIGR
jgi:outer membrane protein TolC